MLSLIRGFDLYGTLIDIETNEGMEEIYRSIAHYLTYQADVAPMGSWRERFYRIIEAQRESSEEYPEIDVEAIWNEFLIQEEHQIVFHQQGNWPRLFRIIYRSIAKPPAALPRRQRYKALQTSYRLALIFQRAAPPMPCLSSGQYALGRNFDPTIESRGLLWLQEEKFTAFQDGAQQDGSRTG